MKIIKYTPDAADKLRDMKSTITTQYGSKKAKEIVGEIMKSIRGLETNEKKGPSVDAMFGVPSDYRYIYLSRKIIFFMT